MNYGIITLVSSHIEVEDNTIIWSWNINLMAKLVA